MNRRFDAIIIGAGQAGTPSTSRLTSAGMSVALIELTCSVVLADPAQPSTFCMLRGGPRDHSANIGSRLNGRCPFS